MGKYAEEDESLRYRNINGSGSAKIYITLIINYVKKHYFLLIMMIVFFLHKRLRFRLKLLLGYVMKVKPATCNTQSRHR